MAREAAWRLFAHEFNKSTIQVKNGDGYGPTYVVSPSGAKMSRVFVVGVLTEVENVSPDKNVWRGHVADPTGSFSVYEGNYQSTGDSFFSRAQVPQYVAILGRARLYTRDDTTYATIWSNEISVATERARNNWVLTTAERTLDRLEALKIGLSAGLHAEELRAKLLANEVSELLADGIVRAVAVYDTKDVIADLVPVIASAVDSVAEARRFAPASEEPQGAAGASTDDATNVDKDIAAERRGEVSPSNEINEEKEVLARNKERALLALSELDSGSGLPYERLIETLEAQDLDEDAIEEAVQELMDEGKCYEPRLGILKLI
jgi:RPA family protein